jgi:hypothetical protein
MCCLAVVASVIAASACACEPPYPPVPRGRTAWGVFDADVGDVWLVVDTDSPAPLDSFAASARALGCSTEHGGSGRRSYSAILARCDAGTMVLTRVGYGRSRFACLRPTTRAQCEDLLRQIALAGRSPLISN